MLVGSLFVLVLAALIPLLLVAEGKGSPRNRLRVRAERIAATGQAGGEAEVTDQNSRRKLIQQKLTELEKQRQKKNKQNLSLMLRQAGLEVPVRKFILGCVGTAVTVFVLLSITGFSLIVAWVGAVGAGLSLPRFFLTFLAGSRQKKFTENFAEALDVLVRGTRSGLPVGECLRIVGRELPDPVGFEFRMLVEGQRVGMTLEQALDRALERMPTTELKFFSIVLMIQQQTGGNLASTLANLSSVLRARRGLRDKIEAMSSEAKASAAIIGSLPFIVCGMIAAVSYGFMEPLFTTRLGHILLAIGLGWMGLGVLVMRQMINFKI